MKMVLYLRVVGTNSGTAWPIINSFRFSDRVLMRRLLLLGLVLVLLGGCTMKATYNRLDWLAAKYLSSYIELTDEQKLVLKQRLADTLEWHRSTQLPAYAQWLGNLQYDMQDGLTESQVNQYGLELLVFWRNLMLRLADDLAVLLPRLTTEQREALFARLEKENSSDGREVAVVSVEKRQSEYAGRLEKGLGRWLGGINEQQKGLIRVAANKLQPTETDSFRMRVRFQQTVRSLLEEQADEDEIRRTLRSLLINNESRHNDAYQKKFENNRRVLTQLIVDISSTMEPDQKKYLNQRIDKFIKLFNDLSGQGKHQASRSCATC